VLDPTLPGAQPECFDSGDKTAQPTNMPMFIEIVTGKPMMMPVCQKEDDWDSMGRLP
jgi:hypothetical protein